MKWAIEYFEQEDITQPAEVFENALARRDIRFAGKLARVIAEVAAYGHQLGGGYIEKCHDYKGLWEIRIIHNRALARMFFGFDGERIVLLHGYTKRVGQRASAHDLEIAFAYWIEYQRTHHLSPTQEEDNEQI